MPYDAVLNDYQKFDFTDPDGRWTRPVWRRGSGPAVIVIHEMPGLHPLVIRFADRVAEAGMTVFCPSLFGQPGRPAAAGYAMGTILKTMCVAREFNVWSSDRSSPIVDWLRALARTAHTECGGRGVGAVGMCFTGGFALAMMTEPSVVAPVLSQPSLPFPTGLAAKASMNASPDEIACAKRRFKDEDLSLLALRFKSDSLVPDARFEAYRAAFGERFEAIELEDEAARVGAGMKPHSVLTVHLNNDDPGGPTRQAEARVIEFFRQRTAAAAPPAPQTP